MANFAKIGLDSKVTDVIIVNDLVLKDSDGNTHETLGEQFLTELYGWAVWKQTFDDGTRKNYSGRGYSYDSERDAFIPLKPYPSWLLNEDSCQWDAPVVFPSNGGRYKWDEDDQEWVWVSD